MTITSRRLSASLLALLAACTFELSPSRPPDDPVPSEDTGDDSVPGSDVAFSIDWTEVADAPLGYIQVFMLKPPISIQNIALSYLRWLNHIKPLCP